MSEDGSRRQQQLAEEEQRSRAYQQQLQEEAACQSEDQQRSVAFKESLEIEAERQRKEKSRIELASPSVFDSDEPPQVSGKKRKVVEKVLVTEEQLTSPVDAPVLESAQPESTLAPFVQQLHQENLQWTSVAQQLQQETSADQRNMILQSLVGTDEESKNGESDDDIDNNGDEDDDGDEDDGDDSEFVIEQEDDVLFEGRHGVWDT